MRTWKIVALLACLASLDACANHVPPAEVVADDPPAHAVGGGRKHRRCVAVEVGDGGADAGADADGGTVARPGCDEGAIGGGGGDYTDDGSGTYVDDGSGGYSDDGTWVDDGSDNTTDDGANEDPPANDPGDEGSADDSGGDEGSTTTESVHVNPSASKGKAKKKGTP